MRKVIIAAIFFLVASFAGAQRPKCNTSNLNASYVDSTNNVQYLCTTAGWQVNVGLAAPSVACSAVNYGLKYTDVSHNTAYICGTSGWAAISGGGGGGGPTQTCNASTVTNYAPAVCVITISSAQILAFDGTFGTAITILPAAGAGKVISINGPVSANYIFATAAYSADAAWVLDYGALEGDIPFVTPDIVQSSNNLTVQLSAEVPMLQDSVAHLANTDVKMHAAAAVTTGDGSVILAIPYTVIPVS